MAIYPHIMQRLPLEATDLSPEKKAAFSNNLIFAFALRKVLAKVAFRTVISLTVYSTLRRTVEGDHTGFEWKDASLETKTMGEMHCLLVSIVSYHQTTKLGSRLVLTLTSRRSLIHVLLYLRKAKEDFFISGKFPPRKSSNDDTCFC